MLLIGAFIVGATVLFLLGWIIAILVARKNNGWIYSTYEPVIPEGTEIYFATASVTPRTPIDPETL